MKIVNASIKDLPGGGSYSIAKQLGEHVGCDWTVAHVTNMSYTFYPQTQAEYDQVVTLLDMHHWSYTTQDYQA